MIDINTRIEQEVNKTIDYIVNNYNLTSLHVEIKENVFKIIEFHKKKEKFEIPFNEKCKGRKINSKQCSRRCKAGQIYCGSHLKSLPFGNITDEELILPIKIKGKRGRKKKINNQTSNYIETRIDDELGDKYLIDNNNYVYLNNVEQPELIGIKKNSIIELLTELPPQFLKI